MEKSSGNPPLRSLDDLRIEIDEVDKELVRWLARRMRLSYEVGRVKRAQGLPLFDPDREEAILKKLVTLNTEPLLTPPILRSIYREILAASRSLQYPVKVAFLGPLWTYSHIAALFVFGHDVEYNPCSSMEEVFESVARNRYDIAVVPVENSVEGSIGITMDLMYRYDLYIVRECYVAMEYHLAGNVEDLKEIREVYAHPRAFSQCRRWLAEHLSDVALVECSSTAQAAELCREVRGRAALCNLYAAHHFGLNVVAEHISDYPDSVTRFIALSREKTSPSGDDKTSIIFGVSHAPGALYRALEPCVRHGVNLTRIESRPARVPLKSYLFFVDLEGHENDPSVRAALSEMEDALPFVKILGSYPRASDEPVKVNKEMIRSESVGGSISCHGASQV
ncbi:prephenate dehydratase [Thermodesulforhabdus norvegica]|uniref:Bifunctional chorismate mutase/prephenate dehydratase n=1 Tax=Thermodesulforhabdus norvegica TaxID=39841 RepID=A0A1I4RMQ7_9BACT|nr:prephenate dehydratase [Thermodesulforhabdus norvegica]SFM53213.1 chorismate mutase / prephenate dehydratase [Thermodesulforhabdus norvegica]